MSLIRPSLMTKASLLVLPILAAVAIAAVTLAGAQQKRMVRMDVPASPANVELKGDETRVPMTRLHLRPVVDVRLDGKGPFPFILDTGAAGTVVDESLVDELNLPVVGEVLIGSPLGGEPIPSRRVAIDGLSLGEVTVSGLNASSLKLPGMFRGENAPRGVLSAHSFPGLLLTFDFPRDEVILRRGSLPEADGKTVFQYTAEDMFPTITIDVAGVKIPAHLDTGSPSVATIPTSYAERLPLASDLVKVGRGRTVDAEIVIMGAPLKGDLTIGSHRWENPKLHFNERLPVANIGSGILSEFALTLDSGNRRISLVK